MRRRYSRRQKRTGTNGARAFSLHGRAGSSKTRQSQLFERIQRFDIIRKFDIRPSEGEIPRAKPVVNPDHSFRSLVDVLSESITSTELESLKQFCWDDIPGGRRQYLNDLQSFLAELEARGHLGKDNLNFLIELMDILGRRDLVNVVKIFEERKEVVRPSGAGGHVLTLGYQRGKIVLYMLTLYIAFYV